MASIYAVLLEPLSLVGLSSRGARCELIDGQGRSWHTPRLHMTRRKYITLLSLLLCVLQLGLPVVLGMSLDSETPSPFSEEDSEAENSNRAESEEAAHSSCSLAASPEASRRAVRARQARRSLPTTAGRTFVMGLRNGPTTPLRL